MIYKPNKPDYQVPSMAEIATRPWNGYHVVSTFSGCGGSCLGFKMAGFKILWASEFIPAAQETYRANHVETYLDVRDIRLTTPGEIFAQTGLGVGEIDVLEGSPPCASFSTAGKRSEGWQTVRKYSDSKQRVDDLFFEFARLVEGLQPKIFVAENVSGLIKGVAKGYFLMILKRLKAAGYRVEARVLDAQWLGVPQARQRLIFVGTRDDLPISPTHARPLPYRYTIREAIPWLCDSGNRAHWRIKSDDLSLDKPAPSVLTGNAKGTYDGHWVETRVVSDSGGQFGVKGDVTDRPAQTICAQRQGDLRVESGASLDGYATGVEWDTIKPGEQSEKYFNLVRADPDRPSPVICASHGSSGIASVTHPFEKRKFSIAELKRVCGFPDDFILTGTYAQQWERLGRAVPPVMMAAVARTVQGILDDLSHSEKRRTI